MICLPGKDVENRVRELRALYLSWLLALSQQPPDLRTDLLIFTDGNGANLARSLGCVEDLRRDSTSPSRCVISPYTPIEDRSRPANQPEDPLLRYSGYINSIVSFAEYDGFDYHLVLRTDTDVFLAPGFYNWTLPENVTLLAGQGGYTVENAAAHLSYVSKTLGLRNEFNHPNVGSTWFGNLGLARAAARLSAASARWLIAEEYSEFEKCCAGSYGWPHWHWGVVSMYSGHLALNHIGNFAKPDDGHGLLDATSTNPDSVSNLKIKHVHCWHTDDRFSKFTHSRKGYDGFYLTPFSPMATVKDFALVLAVRAFLGLLALPFGPMGMVVLGAVGAGLGSLVGVVLDRRERRTGRLLASREHRRLKYLIRYASDRFPRSDDPAGFLESVITEFKPVAEIGTISNTAKKELTLLYSFLCRDDVHQCLWIYTDDFLKNWRTLSSIDFLRICVDILRTLVSMDEALSSKPQFEVVKRMKAFIEHPNIKPIYEHSQWHPPPSTQKVIESLMYKDALERGGREDSEQGGIIREALRKATSQINKPWRKTTEALSTEVENGEVDTPYVSPASSSRFDAQGANRGYSTSLRGESPANLDDAIRETDLFVLSKGAATETDDAARNDSRVAVATWRAVSDICLQAPRRSGRLVQANREVFFKDFDDFLNFDLDLKHKLPIGLGEFRFLEEKERASYTGWDVCVDKTKIKVVKLKSDVSPSVLVRAWATVTDTPAELVLYHIHDFERRVEWDKTFSEMRLLKPSKGDELCDTLYCVLRAPFGVQARDFLQYRRVFVQPPKNQGDKRYLILMRSASRAEMPEVQLILSSYIRAETIISGYIIEQAADSNDTSLFILSQTDIKGLIPKWIVNTAAGRVPVQWVESLEEACRKYRAQHADYAQQMDEYLTQHVTPLFLQGEAARITATSL
ncbi:hypothetical protein FOL46_002247 [Perkinsus olseni]|uniref:START domain-containing protein n=1 Tax=Perkinsus olseni TaxID=32597 RepID=A0A7J6MAB7_PEROL|nr:hypothetical protein FOL46_002247 [Perkinsus olseni]